MRKLFLFFIILFFVNQFGFASDDSFFKIKSFLDSVDKEKIIRLTLQDCIERALRNNSEIKIKRIEPQIAESLVRIKEGVYEPTFDTEISYKDSELPSKYSVLTGVDTDTEQLVNWNFGITGMLPFGTEYEFNFLNTKTKSNSVLQSFYPEYAVSTSLDITQPVLKGFFIDTNRAEILVARNNKEISKQDFAKKVINVIADVKNAYYDYFLSQQLYEIGKLSLRRAEKLYSVIKERYRKGMASSVDLLESEAGLAQREEALLELEGRMKSFEDNLKLVTNIVDDPELWDAKVVTVEKPRLEFKKIDLPSSIKEAFKYRPDYKMAKLDLKNKDVKLRLARDNIMPQVDLVGSFSLNGLTGEYEKSTKQVFDDREYDEWNVGIEVSVPFGFEKEIADLKKNKLEKRRALLNFYRLEQNIILEVRDAARWVDIAYRKVKATEKTKITQQSRYSAVKKRFRAGLVSTHDILEYEEDFRIAEANYLQAIIDYNKSICNLRKVEGTILVENNIKIEE